MPRVRRTDGAENRFLRTSAKFMFATVSNMRNANNGLTECGVRTPDQRKCAHITEAVRVDYNALHNANQTCIASRACVENETSSLRNETGRSYHKVTMLDKISLSIYRVFRIDDGTSSVARVRWLHLIYFLCSSHAQSVYLTLVRDREHMSNKDVKNKRLKLCELFFLISVLKESSFRVFRRRSHYHKWKQLMVARLAYQCETPCM